ncbi:MAG TPA: NAD(P)-dependent oxidoreductase [Alphaproteobacteria bacterium]|nr:NAD(P)-dependent oxidoreductase [Alphaproteobacteria bacterium]
MRVGYVGLGSMGGDQARLLAKSPFDFMVYDVSATALAAFEGKAKIAGSLAELGRDRDVISICVRDDQQVRDVLEGAGRLLDSMIKGSIVLVHSTVKPETIVDLAGKAARRGVTLIDAPVTRTVMQSGGQFVFTMTGGAEAVTERVRPILEVYSTDVVHVGPLGSAMVLKISNNLVAWVELLVGRQAFTLAMAGGVPLDKLAQVMKRNGNLTPTMEAAFVDGPRRFTGSPADRAAFMDSQGRIGEKDLELAISLGDSVGVAVPTAIHAKEFVRKAMVGQ